MRERQKIRLTKMSANDAAELRNYLINPKEIDLRKKLLIGHMIKLKLLHNPVPIANIQTQKGASTKTGTGIKFLPSDTTDLQRELAR